MIYTPDNVRRPAEVRDMTTGEAIKYVRRIDTDTGEVEIFHYPFVLNRGKGDAETYIKRFERIEADTDWIGLATGFRCYG